MSHEKTLFLEKADTITQDSTHIAKLTRATNNHRTAVSAMTATQFRDWQEARKQAAAVKDYALAHLPDLLETFEEKLTARGGKVLWAEDAAEAQQHVLAILKEVGARKIVKSKTMVSEEIELNELLEEHKYEVLETDLGELIVQLAGEKPYHIVTPAMHKTKEEIGELFHQTLHTPRTDDAEELTMAAREHLRQQFVTADVGITGCNFLIADQGAIAVTENEGNARLTMSCPPVHIVLAGMEKMLPRLADLPLFLPLLATSGTGQQVTSYNSVVRGPRQEGEVDGPGQMIVILIDNGRSKIYQKERFREVLRCIRCGSCLNACPIFKSVGGHTYHTTYQGPIGSVLTPQFKGVAEWSHLSQASSLCGACSEACPVHIELHELLLANRWEADQAGIGKGWKLAMKGWAMGMQSRGRMNLGARFYKLFGGLIPMPGGVKSALPKLADKPFSERWKDL